MVSFKRAKILIVDDIKANLITLRAVLECPKYDLIEASSGTEAVELCNKEEFALIVLDVSMPGLNGFEAARQIKTQGKNKDVPIIFVTATYKEDPSVRKGFEVGAIDYFGKPFDPDILKAKVGIYTDLYLKTKRLEQTEELLKTHAQIKTLLEAIPVGVIITDAEGQVYESNEEARRICSVGRNDWAITRAISGGESVKEEEIDFKGFDGEKKSIVNSAYPIRSTDGKILGAVAVIQDVTSRKKIAEDIELRTRQLLKDVSALNAPTRTY